MPHTEHRKKTLRKAEKARERNRVVRARVRTAMKAARTASAGTPEGKVIAETAQALIDKAARGRTMHPNKAARLKSRLSKQQKKNAAAK